MFNAIINMFNSFPMVRVGNKNNSKYGFQNVTNITDLRELIMSYLNFQDNKALSQLSKNFHQKVTIESKNVFWLTFYIEYFGQKPDIEINNEICMKEMVLKAQQEFNNILTNSNELRQSSVSTWGCGENISINSLQSNLMLITPELTDRLFFIGQNTELDNKGKDSDIRFYGQCRIQRVPFFCKQEYYNHHNNEDGTSSHSIKYIPLNCDVMDKFAFRFEKGRYFSFTSNLGFTPTQEQIDKLISRLIKIEYRFSHRSALLIQNIVHYNVGFVSLNMNLKEYYAKSKIGAPFEFVCEYIGNGRLQHLSESPEEQRTVRIHIQLIDRYVRFASDYKYIKQYCVTCDLGKSDVPPLRKPFRSLFVMSVLNTTALELTKTLFHTKIEIR